MKVKLAVPDVVNFDYRRPSGSCRCPSPPDDCRRQLDGLSRLPFDGSSTQDASSTDLDAICRSVSVDPDMRLVQSSVTGDWRFVRSSPQPQVCDELGPRRRRYGSMLPRDLGVGKSTDLTSGSRTADVLTVIPTSSMCQVDLSLRASGAVVSPPEVVDSLAEVLGSSASDMVQCSRSSERRGEDFSGSDVSVLFGREHGEYNEAEVVNYSTPEVTAPCTSVFASEVELVNQLSVPNESATDVIRTSPSSVRSIDNVGLYARDVMDTDKAETREDGCVPSVYGFRHGGSNVDLVKNCALTTEFATDADLEADLLSARLLRDFREAIKSAVDSISSGRSQPEVSQPCYAVPCSNFTSQPSFVSVERVEKCRDGFGSSSTSILTTSTSHSHSSSDSGVQSRTCTESAFQRFRMSNIPTLNGVNRCKRSVVRDDLTTATHRSTVTQNVLRHRRSLPDTNQLRCLSSSRDATFPSRTNVRMPSSLVVGGSSLLTVDHSCQCMQQSL